MSKAFPHQEEQAHNLLSWCSLVQSPYHSSTLTKEVEVSDRKEISLNEEEKDLILKQIHEAVSSHKVHDLSYDPHDGPRQSYYGYYFIPGGVKTAFILTKTYFS